MGRVEIVGIIHILSLYLLRYFHKRIKLKHLFYFEHMQESFVALPIL